MADPEPAETPAPTPKRSRARPKAAPVTEPATEKKPERETKKAEGPRVPRRPTLDPESARLLAVRDAADEHRPVFGRQQANRYLRVGRRGSWRRPTGVQSKQRRHYGYRPRIVRIGYRSRAAVRGLTPTGFRPVLVHTADEIDRIEPATEAAIIARTVGTRRRLVLEESARRRGVKILNPIVREEAGT